MILLSGNKTSTVIFWVITVNNPDLHNDKMEEDEEGESDEDEGITIDDDHDSAMISVEIADFFIDSEMCDTYINSIDVICLSDLHPGNNNITNLIFIEYCYYYNY